MEVEPPVSEPVSVLEPVPAPDSELEPPDSVLPDPEPPVSEPVPPASEPCDCPDSELPPNCTVFSVPLNESVADEPPSVLRGMEASNT